MKGSQKPKKLGKKPAQKTLKERRTAKRAAAKHASRGLDVYRKTRTERELELGRRRSRAPTAEWIG